MGGGEHRFEIDLDDDAWIEVRYGRDPIRGLDWAAVLTVEHRGGRAAVCLYDNAHGRPERHRYRRGRKLAAEEVSPRSSPRHDLPAAIGEIKANWEGMVDRWEP